MSDTAPSIKRRREKSAEIKILPGDAAAFREAITGWFVRAGRDLPWRRNTDPYAVLVSEFMLQQTQVVTVVDFFNRWMRRFPSLRALAEADEQAVLAEWQGLGYYSRARNLWRTAQAVQTRCDGRFPESVDALRELPGIGEYTASAVAAFAFDQAVPVVDANVARVLVRLHDFRDRIDTSRGRAFLRAAATALQAEGRGGRIFNSALMELGALVCKPGRPDCPGCPVREFCRTPVPEALPVKAARATVECVSDVRWFISDGTMVYLEQSGGPRWRGMWMLPPGPARGRPVHELVYPITRYRVRLRVYRRVPGADDWMLTGFPSAALGDIPIPAPHRRAIRALLARGGGSVHSRA